MLSNKSLKLGKKYSLQFGHFLHAKEAPYLDVNAPAEAVTIVSNPLKKIKVLVEWGIYIAKEFLLIVSRHILSTTKKRKKAQDKCIATDQGIFDLKTVNPPNNPCMLRSKNKYKDKTFRYFDSSFLKLMRQKTITARGANINAAFALCIHSKNI